MIDNGIKRLSQQGIGLRKMNAGRDRFRQLFREVTMQCIFRPQHFTTGCSSGGQLDQCILLVVRHAQHTLARHQRPGVALTGWPRQQALRTRLRQFAILLCDSAQFRAFFCPRDERLQRLCQHGLQLRVHRTFGILTCQRHAERIVRTVCQQTVQVEWTTGFWTGDLSDGFVDTGMHAEGQAIAGGVNLFNQLVEVVTVVAHHVQYRAKDLFFQLVEAGQFNQRWRHKGAGLPLAGILAVFTHGLEDRTAFGAHGLNVVFDICFGFRVDNRPDIGRETARVTHTTFPHRAAQHLQRVVCHVILQTQHAQGGTALARAVEGGGENIDHHLLGERGGVDDHGVHAAGFSDERRWTPLCIKTGGDVALQQGGHFS